MNKRIIKDLSVTSGDANVVRVQLTYNKGGFNLWTYKEEERGLYLSVSPLRIEHGDGYITTSYTGFSGIKQLVKPLKRFSQKQLDTFEPEQETIDTLVNHVISKNLLTIEQ
jgi:hypothetical protein